MLFLNPSEEGAGRPQRIQTSPGMGGAHYAPRAYAAEFAATQEGGTGFDTHAWELPDARPALLVRRAAGMTLRPLGYARETVLAAIRRLGDLTAQARVQSGLAQVNVLLGSCHDARAHSGQAPELYQQLASTTPGRAHIGLAACGLDIGTLGRQGHRQAALA